MATGTSGTRVVWAGQLDSRGPRGCDDTILCSNVLASLTSYASIASTATSTRLTSLSLRVWIRLRTPSAQGVASSLAPTFAHDGEH